MTLGTVIDLEDPPGAAGTLPLPELMPRARLIELSGRHACARTTTAVSCVIHAQAHGELVAWVQHQEGALFPPDLEAAGVDLDSFIAIHVPRTAGPFALARAAEWLARSGAFGLTVIDLTDTTIPGSSTNWQGRLQSLLRRYDSRILLLTSTAQPNPSSGPLVGLRIQPDRSSLRADRFRVHARILKDKIGLRAELPKIVSVAPAGLRGRA